MSSSTPDAAQSRFEDLLQFPCEFTFRAVGDTGPTVEAAARAAVAVTLGRPVGRVEQQPSRKGNYLVLRLTAVVLSADEIRAVYAALDGVDGIRMVM